MRVYDGEKLKDTDPKAKTLQEYKDDGRRRRRHDGHLHPLRLQDAVGDLQLRRDGGRRRPGASDVCAGTGDQARAVSPTRPRRNISNSSRPTRAALCRVHRQGNPEGLSGSPTANTARTCSTATSPMPMRGSRIRISRTPTPASCSTAQALDNELSKIEKPAGIANPKDFRNEVVKFALRYRAPKRRQESGLDGVRENPRGDREAHVHAGRGSCCRSSASRPRRIRRPRTSTTSSSSACLRAATRRVRCAGSSNGTCGSTRRDRRESGNRP